jgi:phage-related protein
MSAWSTFSLFMESLGAAVGSTLQVAWNRLVEWATNVFGSINSVISQSWETLVAVFSLIGSGINNVLHPMFSRLVEWFLDVGGKIAGSLTNAWRRIVNFFGEIADAAERIWRQFKKLLSKISSSVIRFFTGGEERRASGGLITEPVVGIGLSTNRRYTIGETGPEMVTPLSGGAAGAGAGTVNLTVNMNVASNVDMQRAIGELEQRMQKLLRRRGMI